MFKDQLFKHLPHNLTKYSLSVKVLLGVFLLVFFSGFQPVLGFPPIKQNIARAQLEQSQTVAATELPFKFQNPHSGYISTRFSLFHPGIDIATPLGTQIHPIAPGTVIDTSYNYWGLGQTVSVDHGSGYSSLYAHMGKVEVKTGQKVSPDDILGEVGLTGNTSGPHTHLQVSKDGKDINPQTLLPDLPDHP